MSCEARQILMQQEATTTPRARGRKKGFRDYLWESSSWGHQSKLKVRQKCQVELKPWREYCVAGAGPVEEMKESQILLEMFPKTERGEDILWFFSNIHPPSLPSMPFIGQTFPEAWKT